ncbi:hypothetical protein DEM28_27980, partial [Enterobacter mori]
MVRALEAQQAGTFADPASNLVALSLKLFAKFGKLTVARVASRNMEGHTDALGPAHNITCNCSNLFRGCG